MKQSETRSDTITINVLYEFVELRLQSILAFNTNIALQKLKLTIFAKDVFGGSSSVSPFEPIDINSSKDMQRHLSASRRSVYGSHVFFDAVRDRISGQMVSGNTEPSVLSAHEIINGYYKKKSAIAEYVRALHTLGASKYIVDKLEDYIPKVILPFGMKSSFITQHIVLSPFENPNTKVMYDIAVSLVEDFKEEIYVWEVENLL